MHDQWAYLKRVEIMYITLKWENVENVAVDLFSTLSNSWVLIKRLDRQTVKHVSFIQKKRLQRASTYYLHCIGMLEYLFKNIISFYIAERRDLLKRLWLSLSVCTYLGKVFYCGFTKNVAKTYLTWSYHYYVMQSA